MSYLRPFRLAQPGARRKRTLVGLEVQHRSCALAGALRDGDGQHLAPDVVEILLDHVQPLEVQMDAIGDVEPAVLAQVLQETDDLSGQATVAQRFVKREIERHHLSPSAGHGEALLPAHAELHVVGAELDRPAGERERDRLCRLRAPPPLRLRRARPTPA